MSVAHLSHLQSDRQYPEIWTFCQKVLDWGDRDPESDERLDDIKTLAGGLGQMEWFLMDPDDLDRAKWRLLATGRRVEGWQYAPPPEPYDVYTAHWGVALWVGLTHKATNHREAAQAVKHALVWLEIALDRERRRSPDHVATTLKKVSDMTRRLGMC